MSLRQIIGSALVGVGLAGYLASGCVDQTNNYYGDGNGGNGEYTCEEMCEHVVNECGFTNDPLSSCIEECYDDHFTEIAACWDEGLIIGNGDGEYTCEEMCERLVNECWTGPPPDPLGFCIEECYDNPSTAEEKACVTEAPCSINFESCFAD